MSIYLKQVTDLISTLDGSTDEGDQPIDADAAHTALDPLLSQFDPRAFDKYVEALSKAKPTLELDVRRKTKEDALERIRRFQAKLKNNGVLKHVAGNPISDVSLRPLRETLKG